MKKSAPAAANIKDFASQIGRFTSEQIGVHGVVYECEVAGLPALAENDRLGVFEERGAKFGEHAGVRRNRILARAKNIEVAEGNGFEAVAFEKRLTVKFADVLGDAVRGNGLRLHSFDLGKNGRLTIGGRGGSKHHAFDFLLLCSHNNGERAL